MCPKKILEKIAKIAKIALVKLLTFGNLWQSDMKTPQFTPRKFVSRNTIYWGIWVPAYLSPQKKSGYVYYSTLSEARVAKSNYLAATRDKSEVRILSKTEQLDALRAYELLTAQGLSFSLVDAVEAAIPALKTSGQVVTVSALFAEFEAVKASSWSAKSMKNYKDASKLFLPEFGARSLVEVTARDLTAWLTTRFESEGYRANITRTIRPAFSYAWRQGMIPQSPFDKIEKVKVVKKDIDVFTVDEARALMDAAAKVSTPTRAAFAVLLFAGVRPAELTRLKWGDVRDGFIHLPARITKIQQARNVELEPILAARLEEWRGDDDAPITPKNWERISKAVRSNAGLSGRQDTARHSYASYHLALHKDESTLKANLGHSRNSDMLFVHYRAAVTRREAIEYWHILA